MKTAHQIDRELERQCGTLNRIEIIQHIQSDARADLEAENKALRERAESAEAALKVYDDELSGASSGATMEFIRRLKADKEKAEASFKERDLQMKAALEETESMFQRTQRVESENVELRERLEKAEQELKEYMATFDLQRTRIHKATALWQTATGKSNTLPDLGDLLDWLTAQKEKSEAACAEMREELRGYLHVPPCRCLSCIVIRRITSSTCGQPLLDRMKAMEDILKDCQHLRSQVFPMACFPECPACRWKAIKEATA